MLTSLDTLSQFWFVSCPLNVDHGVVVGVGDNVSVIQYFTLFQTSNKVSISCGSKDTFKISLVSKTVREKTDIPQNSIPEA